MTRAWRLDGKAKAAQVVPAKLGAGGLRGLLGNPGSDFWAGPQPAIGGRSSEQRRKGLLLEGGEPGDFAGIGSPAVHETGRAELVVAADEVAEPISAEPHDGGGILR